jgi:beta propeller repeat protein
MWPILKRKTRVELTLFGWRRYLLLVAAACLPFFFLKLLSAAFFQANNPDFPWIVTPVEQRERIGRLTVHANQVAWIDWEDPEGPIMIKNLETGEVRTLLEELPCPGYTSYDSRLDMDGDWLVSVFNCGGFDYEVQAFNLATNELIYIQPPPDAPPEQVLGLDPAIHNEKVVWFQRSMGENADLYLYDLQTRTAISLTANGGPVVEIHPDIYGDWVVWDSYNLDTYDHSLVAYNLLSGEQITHPVASYPYHIFPRIYEDVVVWDDVRNDGENGDIYGYDLATHQEFPIVTTPASQYAPYIHQNLLAYKQQVIGVTGAVYVHDLLSGESAFIHEENDANSNDPVTVYDITVHDGLIGFYESYVEPDIIYVARRLPERVYIPIFHKTN